METIIVPVDGASNIKLEVLDYHTFAPLFSKLAATPVAESGVFKCNATARQFAWYESTIFQLPNGLKEAKVIACAARGASGGLISGDNALTEFPGEGLTLSYDHPFPPEVERAFAELAGSEQDFFAETGSILRYPGSLTLLKRFLFEQMERPGVLERSTGFATYGALMAGHFLGPDYLEAVAQAGNEHGYWMCHSGARNITGPSGTPSTMSSRIESFKRLVPARPSVVYRPLGKMATQQAGELGLPSDVLVIPGGHDTCLSHIPVVSAFRRAFPALARQPVIHLEAGSWTMVSLIGSGVELPSDGYRKGVIVQGTVDGVPVVTSMYGGGRDFSWLGSKLAKQGLHYGTECDELLLEKISAAADCFVLPNINPENHGTGPFPAVRGRIVKPDVLFRDGATAMIVANLCVVNTVASQIKTLTADKSIPVILTGGGSRDPLFGRLLATISAQNVFVLFDKQGQAVNETTTLGAAIAGKAACMGVHPDDVDLTCLGLVCRRLEPFDTAIQDSLAEYRAKFIERLNRTDNS